MRARFHVLKALSLYRTIPIGDTKVQSVFRHGIAAGSAGRAPLARLSRHCDLRRSDSPQTLTPCGCARPRSYQLGPLSPVRPKPLLRCCVGVPSVGRLASLVVARVVRSARVMQMYR